MELKYLNSEDFDIDTSVFSSYIKKLRDEVSLFGGILNVVFVNDLYIRALNKSYRGKDAPTDVLSFNYDFSEGGDGLIGEVYISVETAVRQAKEHGFSLSEELSKLLVHGVLHIHGYDHEEDEDYQKMYIVEQKVLGKLAGEKL
jgi:probable rRNA maturation factor